jgi:hypothetical protein
MSLPHQLPVSPKLVERAFEPERPLFLEHGLIELEPFRLSKSKVIRQVISDQPTEPGGRAEAVPLESSNVIVPSKSLKTTILVSPAINGIPTKSKASCRVETFWV